MIENACPLPFILSEIPYFEHMQANKNFSIAIQICVFMDFKGAERYSSQELAEESLATNPVVVRRQLARLKEAGIVASQNGPNGGFYLTRDTTELNLWELYEATREGDFFNRPKPNPNCVVSSNLKYLVDDTFYEAEMAMKPALSSVTIKDLCLKLHKILDCQ